jgi:outer membrane biosynthesis protein TonB
MSNRGDRPLPGPALRGMNWRLEDGPGFDTLSRTHYDSTPETEPTAAMTDLERGHDRGAYTPQTDGAPLAFDAREPRRRRPFPVTLVLSVLILLGLIFALIFIYRSGVREEGAPPQPVGEPVGAVREAAPAEAQPTDAAAGLDVYTDDVTATPSAPVFTAPPEAPVARPAAPAPVAVAPVPAPVQPAPARPSPTPAPAAATPARPATAPVVTPRPAPAPAPTAPTMRPTPPATPPPATPAPAAAPVVSAGGGASAQIGAYNTREQAQAALAGAAGGRSTRVEPVERNGQTLYRAIVTGFPDRAAAQSFCGSRPGGVHRPMSRACILGCAGTSLTPDERDFFRDAAPGASSCSPAMWSRLTRPAR